MNRSVNPATQPAAGKTAAADSAVHAAAAAAAGGRLQVPPAACSAAAEAAAAAAAADGSAMPAASPTVEASASGATASAPPPTSFDSWLRTTGEHFARLSDEDKNRTLDYIIGRSGARQLYHLSEKLNCLLKRDFLKFLPAEMSFYLLRFLDPPSLLACGQVSRTWNAVVSSCVDSWKRACLAIGVKLDDAGSGDAAHYKRLFMTAYARLESLRRGTALEPVYLLGHTDRVMAVYYKDGLLATGSDDRTVRLWDCETGQCLKIFRTHTVADVKFDRKQIVTASFDNTAACWDMATGERVRHYRGHVGAVFTVDYDEGIDILVTGGVDYTIKIWLFSEAILVHSLNTYNAGWITKVLLHRPTAAASAPSSSAGVAVDGSGSPLLPVAASASAAGSPVSGTAAASPVAKGSFAVVCIDYSYIYVWNMDGQQHVKDFRGWPASHSCFVPSLLKDGSDLYCCVSDAQRSVYSVQRNRLTGQGIGSELMPITYPGCGGIQAMFGVGARFSMFLSDTPVDGYMLDIVHENSRKFTSLELPDCRPTRRGSTFTLGERGWLDGFDGENDRGVFFAASLRDHSIYLLKWKPRAGHRSSSVADSSGSSSSSLSRPRAAAVASAANVTAKSAPSAAAADGGIRDPDAAADSAAEAAAAAATSAALSRHRTARGDPPLLPRLQSSPQAARRQQPSAAGVDPLPHAMPLPHGLPRAAMPRLQSSPQAARQQQPSAAGVDPPPHAMPLPHGLPRAESDSGSSPAPR